MIQRPLEWSQLLGDFIQSVSWSPDGVLLAAAGSAGAITVFDVARSARVQGWAGHEQGTFMAGYSPVAPLLVSSGQDGKLRLWSVDRAEPLAVVDAGATWVEQLAWAPDGSLVAVGAGREVSLVRPDGTVQHRLGPLRSPATALAWRADSKAVAAASYGRVQRWLADSGEPEEPLNWKTSLISLAWSPDARWIAAGTQEQSVQIWELPHRPGGELAMSGYPGKVRELAWHFSGRFLATGGANEIMVWDCAGRGPAGTTPRILQGHEQRVTALAYQRAGHLLASGGEDGRVFLWNAGRSSTPWRQFVLSSAVTALAWTRDDRRLAMGCRDGTVAAVTIP